MINRISDEMTRTSTLERECKRLGIPLNGIHYNEELISLEKLKPGAYIINLGDDITGGTHWTCAWIPKKGIPLYFDSFGLPAPIEFEDLVEEYLYNPYTIQDPLRGFCGSYCVEFLQAMNEGDSYDKFLTQFDPDPTKNSRILRNLEKD